MYGKIFPEMFSGSMMGAGCHIFATWSYALATCDETGFVELNPRLLSAQLGAPIRLVEEAIDYLMRPDLDSRSKEEDGRRLVREGQFLYRIVNHTRYRAMRAKEDRLQYQREWDRKNRPSGSKRAQTHQSDTSPTRSDTVPRGPPSPTKAEAEAEAKKKHRKKKSIAPKAKPKFVPPTVADVLAYAKERGRPDFDAAWFVEHYTLSDWRDKGGKPIQIWKQTMLGWLRRDQKNANPEPNTARLVRDADGLTPRQRVLSQEAHR